MKKSGVRERGGSLGGASIHHLKIKTAIPYSFCLHPLTFVETKLNYMQDNRKHKCCSVEGCTGVGKNKRGKEVFQNGLCEKHRRSYKLYGHPEYVKKHMGTHQNRWGVPVARTLCNLQRDEEKVLQPKP